jgi:DNA-binding winged helix-turn-helix (wHTH) protein
MGAVGGRKFVTRRFADFVFDSARRQVTRATGEPVHLTPKAFDLLAILIDEAPRVVQKTEIHERLWPRVFVTDATLVGLIKEIRRSLEDHDRRSPIIRTSHRVGYAFGATLTEVPALPTAHQHWVIGPAGRTALREGENLIGRDPACGVWLDTTGVSRRHARIIVQGDKAEVEDLGSKNGTLLGGRTLTARKSLHDHDRIRIGPVAVTYRVYESGISTETTVKTLTRGHDNAELDHRSQ